MTRIAVRIYNVGEEETVHIAISEHTAPRLTFCRVGSDPPKVNEMLIVVESELPCAKETANWIRDNIKFIDGIPTLPGCKITVIEDSARKEIVNETK